MLHEPVAPAVLSACADHTNQGFVAISVMTLDGRRHVGCLDHVVRFIDCMPAMDYRYALLSARVEGGFPE